MSIVIIGNLSMNHEEDSLYDIDRKFLKLLNFIENRIVNNKPQLQTSNKLVWHV